MLEVCLLGRFEVRYGTEVIPITSRPSQLLFAFLLLNAGTPHRREKLAGMLWADSLEKTARDNLRHALWRIRKALPQKLKKEFINADDLTITFNASSDFWLDAAELENTNEKESSDQLIDILSLYQGELLPGFYDDWVVLEREHLASEFEHHMARLMSLLEDEKRWLDIMDWGERWIKLGSKPEPAYRALMSAHSAKGDLSKVAATYERCVNSMKELGIAPSKQTKTLYERLKTGKEILESGSTTRLSEQRKESLKTNLPAPITNFIGRVKEVKEIIQLMRENRLITLTGVGGVGKTRLAIQSSRSLLEEFDDGVWWVELAPLRDETLVPQTVARTLGVRESPAQTLTKSLITFLSERQLLLVLDNCEHLITACAQFAQDLLMQCANLKILATSREALDIMGELDYQVQPLSLPAPEQLTIMDILLEYEGIHLFVERSYAKSGFTLTEQNATSVLNICKRLDGISLAIELAAARTKTLSIEQIAERLNDRFNLLTQGNRTALPRHQTLRAAIDWSYDLLSAGEQSLFHRLSVFVGGWTLEAAQAVCAVDDNGVNEILDLLARLVDKSLVSVRTENANTRYHMLETIRQYAYEKFLQSNEVEQAYERYLGFFIRLAEESEPNLVGPDEVIWLDYLETELDNLRYATSLALGNKDMEGAARLGTSLWWFWLFRDHLGEGRQLLEKTIELGRRSSQDETMTLGGTVLYAHAMNIAAMLANFQGDHTVGRSRSEEGLALSRKIGNKRLISRALFALGLAAVNQEDYSSAKSAFEESLLHTQELGDKSEIARSHVLLGGLALAQNNYVKARSHYEEGLRLAHEMNSKLTISVFSGNLGLVALKHNDFNVAREMLGTGLLLDREINNERAIIADLVGFASLARALGRLKRATRLSSAAEKFSRDIGSVMDPEEKVEYEKTLSVAQAQLDEETFKTIRAEGRSMTLEQAIEFALKEVKK